MQSVKMSFAARLRNFLIGLLTLSMLLLAGVYIGGAQFFSDSAALRTESLPSGTAPVGTQAPATETLSQKELLPIAFGAIRYGENGGGAYGGNAAASALFTFATEYVHACLGTGVTPEACTGADFSAAMANDYLFFDLLSPLPYQILYALTGDYAAPAHSNEAIHADRLLLTFPAADRATLYLSDGASFYRFSLHTEVKTTELQTLANDSRLSPFSLAANGVPKCEGAPSAGTLTLSTEAVASEAEYNGIFTLFGFRVAGAKEGTVQTVVDPHGTLRLTGTRLIFTASQDGGIAVSDMLGTAKDTLDIDLYDILEASVTLLERTRATLPESTGGPLSSYLAGFSREEDIYTVTFGLHTDGIAVRGNAFPCFAKMTVQGGRFRTVEIRFLRAEQNGYTGTLFPSVWHYTHAEKTARPNTLRLYYTLIGLSEENVEASWYYTARNEVAK